MDESYNASPESVKACIEVLLEYPNKHYIVLGSMRELGEKTIDLHEEILNIISNANIQKCLFICEIALEVKLRKLAFDKSNIIFIRDAGSAISLINALTKKGDSLLIKGSRSWKLEKIIPYIN